MTGLGDQAPREPHPPRLQGWSCPAGGGEPPGNQHMLTAPGKGRGKAQVAGAHCQTPLLRATGPAFCWRWRSHSDKVGPKVVVKG